MVKTVSFYKIILSFNIDNKLTVFIPDLLVDENLLALFDQPNPENKTIVKVLDLDNDEATIFSAIEEIDNKVNSL